MNKDDTLPPEVQAVIDAVRAHHDYAHHASGDTCEECRALRAYDASRKPKERWSLRGGIVVDGASDERVFCYQPRSSDLDGELAERINAWLNAAERGDLITRAECERRVRAADRNAREECAKIVESENVNVYATGTRSRLASAIRATIKAEP